MSEEKCLFYNNCNHIDCNSFCMKRYKCEYYFNSGMIPETKRLKFKLHIDADGTDSQAFCRLAEIEKNIEQYVTEGNNLYVYSNRTGNGKSSWMYRLLRSYIVKTWYKHDLNPIVLFISVPKFLLEIKANISNKSDYIEKIMPYINNCDIVVWDDIGSKAGTEFEVSHLLNIIDYRISNNKTNMYTSNLNKEDLHQLLGDRLYSRIYNYSECIEFKGKDKRGIK